VDAHRPDPSEIALADLGRVANRFRRYSSDDVAITAATFVARPAPVVGREPHPDR
jgi:hypothetical protein